MTTALDALNQARAAWEKTQPQLILGLDEAPAPPAPLPDAGASSSPTRLNPGAEPCCDHQSGTDGSRPVTAPRPSWRGSAPPFPTGR